MRLAINGGIPVRSKRFPNQNTMGIEEKEAVLRVLETGRLSGYRANKGPHFRGGPEVQKLEEAFCEKFGASHAIACNSATSGLFIAYYAVKSLMKFNRISHSKTYVTPWSMTCSATIPTWFNDDPVFCDIEKDYFCIDYETYRKKIGVLGGTSIAIAVSLFGQPYDQAINHIDGYVIEDAAQAIGSYYMNEYKEYAGTIGDIGVFSLNFGKHITNGESGIILTDNDDLAIRCRLIMNHAESVINDDPNIIKDHSLVGLNLRTTELQAAVGRVQLSKFDSLLIKRIRNVNYLQQRLKDIPPISNVKERPGTVHSFYVLPFLYDNKKADGVHRDVFINAVKAELPERKGRDGEGTPISCGYIKPLYRLPLFNIQKSICPNVETLWRDDLFLTLIHSPNSTIEDMKDVADAFEKVYNNLDELK